VRVARGGRQVFVSGDSSRMVAKMVCLGGPREDLSRSDIDEALNNE
jgi:hypothetical protein